MYEVGNRVRYLKDGPNKKLQGLEGTITKIEDGKKTVKFDKAGVGSVLVKAASMELLVPKQEVGVAAKKVKIEKDSIVALDGRIGRVIDLGVLNAIVRWDDGDETVAPLAKLVAAERAAAPVVEPAPAAPAVVAVPAEVVEARVADRARAEDREEPLFIDGEQYALAQKIHGLKVGDKVRVRRAAADGGEGGWGAGWNRRMDERIGKEDYITDVDIRHGFRLGDGFWYPWFVLDLVEVAPVPEVKKEEVFHFQGVDFTVTKDLIYLGQGGENKWRFRADELIQKLALAHAGLQEAA